MYDTLQRLIKSASLCHIYKRNGKEGVGEGKMAGYAIFK